MDTINVSRLVICLQFKYIYNVNSLGFSLGHNLLVIFFVPLRQGKPLVDLGIAVCFFKQLGLVQLLKEQYQQLIFFFAIQSIIPTFIFNFQILNLELSFSTLFGIKELYFLGKTASTLITIELCRTQSSVVLTIYNKLYVDE